MSEDNRRSLIWSEDFTSYTTTELNEAIWNFDLGDGSDAGLIGWGNNEREFYTRDSIAIEKNLVISAKRVSNDSGLQCYYGPAEWKSGKIHTAGKVGFKFGFLEIQAKMPSGVGTWPALWMLGINLLHGTPWPQCGEIDILENTGSHPERVQGTIHGPDYFGENGLTKIIDSSSPLSLDFHKFGIEWTPEYISWFFDGVRYNTITRSDVMKTGKPWPFDQEFYLIMNLAIGGWFAGEVDTDLQSASLEISWIKHYSVDGIGEVIIY